MELPAGAAGALVVVLAARRSWFCCDQLFAVLRWFERRRTGRAEMAAPGRVVLLDARLRVLGHAASPLCVGLLPGRACGPLGAGG